jgi:hypothetical protein
MMTNTKTKTTYWVDFELDNDRDTAQGGIGNWYAVEVEGDIPLEDLADAISDQTGWLVFQIETDCIAGEKK